MTTTPPSVPVDAADRPIVVSGHRSIEAGTQHIDRAQAILDAVILDEPSRRDVLTMWMCIKIESIVTTSAAYADHVFHSLPPARNEFVSHWYDDTRIEINPNAHERRTLALPDAPIHIRAVHWFSTMRDFLADMTKREGTLMSIEIAPVPHAERWPAAEGPASTPPRTIYAVTHKAAPVRRRRRPVDSNAPTYFAGV